MFFEDLATLLSTFSDSPAILISFCNFFINFLFCFDRMRFIFASQVYDTARDSACLDRIGSTPRN